MAGYPTTGEIEDYLSEAGITATSTRLTRARASAISLWEQGTGFVPFIAGASSARLFTLGREWYERAYRDRLFDLPGGLVASETITVVRDGETLTKGEDWWPLPESARYSGEPYTLIRFNTATMTEYEGLSITGRWGWCLEADLPADVFDAIAQKAAQIAGESLLVAGNATTAPGPLISAKETDVEHKWATGKKVLTAADLLSDWAAQFDALLSSYRMPSIR